MWICKIFLIRNCPHLLGFLVSHVLLPALLGLGDLPFEKNWEHTQTHTHRHTHTHTHTHMRACTEIRTQEKLAVGPQEM